MSRQLKLGAFLMATGHHVAAWRHPDVPANAGLNFAHYKHLAQVAQAAKFDALFVADSIAAATLSATNSASNLAASATRARCLYWAKSSPAFAGTSGWRQAATWCPVAMRKAPSFS